MSSSAWPPSSNHGDLSEPLFKSRGLELGGHALDDIFFYLPFPIAVALQANLKWRIENSWTYHLTKALSQLYPLASFVGGQVAGIHVIPGHAGDQASAKQGSKRRED